MFSTGERQAAHPSTVISARCDSPAGGEESTVQVRGSGVRGKKHALIHSHTRFVAVESEPFFHKGARPARRRARHIYDKSGKEGSLMSLGKYSQDDERPLP